MGIGEGMGITSDRNDPRLTHGADEQPVEQAEVYLVLPEEKRTGFVRPVRRAYLHDTCGAVTIIGQALAETYALNPRFYGATYCVTCRMHRPVAEFTWAPLAGEIIAPEYRRVGS